MAEEAAFEVMRSTTFTMAFGVAAVLAVSVAAQAPKAPAKPAAAAVTTGIPRLPDGHPDLQGTYDSRR